MQIKTITPTWPAPPSIQAFTTTQHATDSVESPQTQDFKTRFHLPSEPIWLKQTHSNIAIQATPTHLHQEADASYTQEINRICVVSTADCLPILICNSKGTEVAAIHAGWRGLSNRIIAETFAKLSPNQSWLVWLGPAIGPNKFEVGKDVYDAFVMLDKSHASAFTLKTHEKWLANLYHIATQQLQHLGVTQIYGGNFCTYTQADLFYSYRRDKGHAGRMASLIWITP